MYTLVQIDTSQIRERIEELSEETFGISLAIIVIYLVGRQFSIWIPSPTLQLIFGMVIMVAGASFGVCLAGATGAVRIVTHKPNPKLTKLLTGVDYITAALAFVIFMVGTVFLEVGVVRIIIQSLISIFR